MGFAIQNNPAEAGENEVLKLLENSYWFIIYIYRYVYCGAFFMLIGMLSVSYYFKKFLIDELEIAIKKVKEVAGGRFILQNKS